MKVLFAHDHKFYKDSKNNYYSPGNFPYSVFTRYLSVFDEVLVVARYKNLNQIRNLPLSNGPNVRFLNIPSTSSIIGRLFERSQLNKQIIQGLLEVDAVIARLPSEIGLRTVKLAEKMGKKWAVEVVGCAWNGYWTHGSLIAKLFAPFAYLRTKKVISKSKYTLYVTKYFLQHRYPSNGEKVACSNVEIEHLDDNVLQKKIDFLSKPTIVFKIGLIGSLATRTKGLKTAILALRKLKNIEKNVLLEVVGDGSKEFWLKLVNKYKLNSMVNIRGTLEKGREIENFLDSCHLYIQPSKTEGLPRALIEAMSRSCPAIGSNVGGIPELLDSQFLHSPKNYKRLTDLIINFIQNKKLRVDQAKRNYKVAQEYDKQIIDKRRYNFLKKFRNSD